MYEDYFPITSQNMQQIMPGDRIGREAGSGANAPQEMIGRILHVRRGRRRPRRFSPIPYGGVNRRRSRDQRRSGRGADEAGDRVLTLLVGSGAQYEKMIGHRVRIKVID